MIGEVVVTERVALQLEQVEQPIAISSYHMDSHNCRRVVVHGRVVNEGDIQVPVKPFHIDYRALVPKEAQCTNLIVPVCVSASHIAYGSIRMEPVFMLLGHVAGAAAALALSSATTVQQINYDELVQQLTAEGHVVRWEDHFHDDPLARMLETFGGE